MKEQIIQLIQDKPKHFAIMIKKNPYLIDWVTKNSIVSSDNISEMVYCAIHQTSNICKNGNIKKFKGINDGYSGCGTAAHCACVRESVSESISLKSKSLTPEQKQITLAKRTKTNLEKYGVACTAQMPDAIQKSKAFYSDPAKLEKLLSKMKQDAINKYGADHCKNISDIDQQRLATILEKYNVSNINNIPSAKGKLEARVAEYKTSDYILKSGFEQFSNYVLDNYNFSVITTIENYNELKNTSSKSPLLTFSCNVCNTVLDTKFYYGRGLHCNTCNPIVSSIEKQSVYNFINVELGIAGIQSDKAIISPYEVDMVFHTHKIAIDYCELANHCEASNNLDKNHHQNKLKLVSEKGYRLITIFSDEWMSKQDIVKSKLRHVFKKNTTSHYARKTEVRIVSSPDSKLFLNNHHLQGNSAAPINLGLYLKNSSELLALMTFSHGRKALNTKSTIGDYELVRFVTNGSAIVGGASKLLKHFINQYKPNNIISYADLRWSSGDVYTTIGFTTVSHPTVGYWYVDDYKTRYHRFNFTKNNLVAAGADINKTEWEIMQELGYDRIWDCGHQKFIMKLIG